MVNSMENNDELLSKTNGPRVSFNRDVHVKRYGSLLNNDSLNYDSNSRSQSPALRREYPTDLSEKALEREAAYVIEQVNTFGSLPRRNKKQQQQQQVHQQRKPIRRSKSDASSSKKQNFLRALPFTTGTNSPTTSSINSSNNKKTNNQKQSNDTDNSVNGNKKVTRSKSDLSSQSSSTELCDKYRMRIHLNSNLFHNNNNNNSSDSSDNHVIHKKKIPLSPITEVSTPLLSEATNNINFNEILTNDLSKRHSKSMETMHSSQMPIEKPSLTRGMAVDKIVKRLSTERLSPPPVQILQAGGFSYTNPSPLKSPPVANSSNNKNESDVVYAQVVCSDVMSADGSKTKQSKETIHETIKASRQSSSPMLHLTKNKKSDKLIIDDNDFVATAKSPSPLSVNGSTTYRSTLKIESDYERDEVDNSAGEPKIRPVNIRHHIPRHSSNSNLNHINYQQNHLDSEFDQLNEMRDADTFNSASLSSRRKILESRIKSRIHGLQLNNNNDNHHYNSNIRVSTSPPPPLPPPTTSTLYNKYGGSNDIMNRYEGNHEASSTQQYQKSKSNYLSGSSSKKINSTPTSIVLPPKNEKGDSGIEADGNMMMSTNRQLNTSRFDIGRRWNYEDDIIECELFLMKERKHTEETYPFQLVRTFVHRERSIDDGSHYDPNLDKANIIKEWKHSKKITKDFLKTQVKKKKSGIEKVKELFKSNKSKTNGVSENELKSRYREYSPEIVPPPKYNIQQDIANRRRLSTPTASPVVTSRSRSLPPSKGINRKTSNVSSTLKRDSNKENNSQKFNWFTSLERLSRKKSKDTSTPSSTIDRKSVISRGKSSSMKNISSLSNGSRKTLRFFGDTDADDTDANSRRPNLSHEKSSSLQNLDINRKSKPISRSRNELQNISESTSDNEFIEKPIRRTVSPVINSSLPPARPPKSSKLVSSIVTLPRPPRRKMFVDESEDYRPQHESTPFYHQRRDNFDSDSNFSSARRLRESMSVSRENLHRDSDASQRSVVYLHATTVGDIPQSLGGRKMSGKSTLQDDSLATTVRTVNRSYSLSAPWKPKFISDGYEIEYNNDQQKNRTRSKSASRDRSRFNS